MDEQGGDDDDDLGDLPKLIPTCEVCEEPTERRCPCLTIAYCGPACQKQDWDRHKDACKSARATLTKTAPSSSSSSPPKRRPGSESASSSLGCIKHRVGGVGPEKALSLGRMILGALTDMSMGRKKKYLKDFIKKGGFDVYADILSGPNLQGDVAASILECINKLKNIDISAMVHLHESGCVTNMLQILKEFKHSQPVLAIIVHSLGYCALKHRPTLLEMIEAGIIGLLNRLFDSTDVMVLTATMGALGMISTANQGCRPEIVSSGTLLKMLGAFSTIWNFSDTTTQHMMLSVIYDMQDVPGVMAIVVFDTPVYRCLVRWFASASPETTTVPVVGAVGKFIFQVFDDIPSADTNQARHSVRPIVENLINEITANTVPAKADLVIRLVGKLLRWNQLAVLGCPLLRKLIRDRITPWIGREWGQNARAICLLIAVQEYPLKYEDDPNCSHPASVLATDPSSEPVPSVSVEDVVKAFQAAIVSHPSYNPRTKH